MPTNPMPPMPPHKPPVEEQACCIIGACCDVDKRTQELADKMVADLGVDPALALKIATWTRANWDLAPAGLLQPLIDNVAANVRAYPKYETS
jgi:hypothetical protein